MAGVLLERLTWQEAELALRDDALVVIPLGAAAKEHGPHLKLNNDWLLSEYVKERLLESEEIVVAPTVAYHFYPAFVEYPGSITLSLETATAMIVEIVGSLARFGPRRFYVLNTGISTERALEPACRKLHADGILLAYTKLGEALSPIETLVLSQEGGSHADEGETSMMLFIAPDAVDMGKAARDYIAGADGPLTRDASAPGSYSPSGIWGDATLATREKGEQLVSALLEHVRRDLRLLAGQSLP